MAKQEAIQIRLARADEMDAVLELTLEAYQEFSTKMPAANWRGLSRTLVRTLQQPGDAQVLVAELDGELCGSVLLFPADSDAYGNKDVMSNVPELRMLAVKPSARGQGIGKQLMEACIERARAAGAAALGLHTGDSMDVALPMYERRGFVRLPQLDFDVPDGELVKAYRLDLTSDSTA